MKPNEEEKQHSMFDPLFNDTHSYAEDEKEYFTIESKEKKELLDVEDNIYENAGIFSTIFFKWVSPVISVRIICKNNLFFSENTILFNFIKYICCFYGLFFFNKKKHPPSLN